MLVFYVWHQVEPHHSHEGAGSNISIVSGAIISTISKTLLFLASFSSGMPQDLLCESVVFFK